MDCYQISLPMEPEIKFAFSVKSNRYEMHIDDRTDVMEMFLNLGDTIQVVLNGKYLQIPTGSLFCFMPGTDYSGTLLGDQLYTLDIAVKCNTPLPCDTVDSADCNLEENSLILPLILDVSASVSRFSSLFNAVILHHMDHGGLGAVRALASLYELFSTMMEMCCLNHGIPSKNHPIGQYYSEKVKALLDENPARPLSVKSLAESMNITPNYLCTVFRKSFGLTITEYRNRLRMRNVRERLNEASLSESQLAEEVGIGSVRYLQRLFKSVYGRSIQECKLIDREISRYALHKPWESE